MKLIRKILVKILGIKGYLRLVSRTYIISISMGWMRSKYPELFFLKKLIKPGDVVLDIGANLSYYSYFMAVSAGKNGRVIAVEPIPLFAEVWKKNMRHLKGYTYQLENCALGLNAESSVRMSIPVVDGVVRHGLTKVVTEADQSMETAMSFEVPMKNGDALIQGLGINRLDFIKCDVEGFEQYVIPSLEATITRFLPTLQIELSGTENRQRVVDYLLKFSYKIFILQRESLKQIEANHIFDVNQDFYFIHESRLQNSAHLIN